MVEQDTSGGMEADLFVGRLEVVTRNGEFHPSLKLMEREKGPKGRNRIDRAQLRQQEPGLLMYVRAKQAKLWMLQRECSIFSITECCYC